MSPYKYWAGETGLDEVVRETRKSCPRGDPNFRPPAGMSFIVLIIPADTVLT